MTSPLLAAVSLGKRLGHREVLKGASFEARSGKLTALMGRNGSGKSTLLETVTGWRRPDFGAVHFAGRVWLRPRLHRMARHGLFYLPQEPPLSSAFTIRTYFDVVARRFGRPAADQAVDLLVLSDLLERYPPMLSTGERARVAVGLALARGPRCLLADEPFTGLAPLDQELIGTGLTHLAGSGAAVVVTGHEVPILFSLAQEIVWVVSGITLTLGSPREARAHAAFRREYLGLEAASGPA